MPKKTKEVVVALNLLLKIIEYREKSIKGGFRVTENSDVCGDVDAIQCFSCGID